jgi:hypothetical protein
MDNEQGVVNNGETQGGSPTPSGDQGVQQQPPAGSAPTAQGAAPDQQGQPQGGDGRMVPSYRLREVTERNRQLEQYAVGLQKRLEALEARQGTAQEKPQDDRETQLIREQFSKMFPNLAKLNELNVDQLSQVLNTAPQQQQQWEQYWQNIGQNTLRGLQSKITEVYGEKVDPVTRGVFESAFISYVERDPDARERYLSQDPSLVEDFWKRATAAVIDPVRKSAAAQVAQRVQRVERLPSAQRSNTAIPGQKPPKPKTEDEMHDAAWNAMQSQL